jgi:nucleoid-associated protein YgaU
MRRHPAGKGIPGHGVACNGKQHIVRAGESLWTIAADELGTDELARIARYWPRIHKLNRALIGSNPNLIYAGQVLEMPAELQK